MRLLSKVTVTATCAVIGFTCAVAQSHLKDSASENAQLQTVSARARRHDTLSSDDRLSLLAAALDKRVQRRAEPDCSHLVHTVYQAAGLPYKYEPSSYLYAGAENFKRVKSPLPGDIIVWRGHVGIVIEPSQHIFFSYLSSGPGTDNYEAPYWKHRGKPRFYRYVSNHPAASH